MVDVLTVEQRRLNMSRIRSRDTLPEMRIRRGLHARGFRFRLHSSRLPGRPDMVFPRFQAVIFVHGCFWHGHSCKYCKMPATRSEFWRAKIATNMARDESVVNALLTLGWRVAIVWECSIKGTCRLPVNDVFDKCQAFLLSGETKLLHITGATLSQDDLR